MSVTKKTLTKEEALAKMESLCARSEQCEFDITTKLKKIGVSHADMNSIIRHLNETGFLDNSRFAKSFISDKARFAHWGPYKIKGALIAKRIPANIITEAMQTIDAAIWKEAIMKTAESKARTLSLNLPGQEGYLNRKKLFSHLINRGFSGADANRAVKVMKNNQDSSQ